MKYNLMMHNQIFSIYCTKEDCIAIAKDKRKFFPGIHLDITIVKGKSSLKKIYVNQNRRYSLKKGDFIIAIDHLPTFIFDKNYKESKLIYFTSLQNFYDWLDKYLISQKYDEKG